MTLCMYGVLQGENDSECKTKIKEFYNVVKTKKGKFSASRTADARKSLLNNECPTVYGASSYINEIINKFGRL
ncbi:killer protein [Salmonella enterica]|nr:killer protein [Salmonella enterica]